MANRKNYSKISTEGAKTKRAEETKIESSLEPEVEAKVEKQPKPKTKVVKGIKGVVTGCMKLNVRKEPKVDAEVLTTLDKDAEVTIYGEEGEFYKIGNPDIGEYCMKKFISVTK